MNDEGDSEVLRLPLPPHAVHEDAERAWHLQVHESCLLQSQPVEFLPGDHWREPR